MDELYYKIRNFILSQEKTFFRTDLVNKAIEEGLLKNNLENIEILYFVLDDLLSENLVFSRMFEKTHDDGNKYIDYQFTVNNKINNFNKNSDKKRM